MSEPVIEFTNVVKNYKTIKALQNVSFTINRGEIFGYIGPNGAGKTTTMKILVGLIRDYSGQVKIQGEVLGKNSNFGKLIGYHPQDVGFQEWRTVDHALTTFGLLSGLSKAELKQRIPEVLELVGLSDSRRRKIKHLSGGMEQKLKLAQALLHNPPILILDEPLTGLDPTSRWQMKNLFKQLAENNVTIIFSSHILEDVEGIASRIGIINYGVLVRVGSPQELQKELVGGEAVEIIGSNITAYADKIKKLPDISEVKFSPDTPNQIMIVFKPQTELKNTLLQIMEFLTANKVVVWNFNYLKPSLERVYLKYIVGGSKNE